MKISSISIASLLLAALAFVSVSRAEVPASTRLSLDGTWQFAFAKDDQQAAKLVGFEHPGFDEKAFKPIPVPSNWAILGYEEPVYRGFPDDKASEGFYLREFSPPAEWKGKRLLLHFGGVWSSAEVWINGKPIGRHDSGYTSFSFDVTDDVKAGEVNRLAVRVRQVSREYKFDAYDDWTLGGIYREVSLEAMPRKRRIDRLLVQTVFDDQFEDADLNLRVMVSDGHKGTLPGNYPSPGEPYEIRVSLLSKDGAKVAERLVSVPAHVSTDRESRIGIRVPRPRHWNAESPYLYDLRVEILEKGKATHARTERVGFRQISTSGGVFKINGQAVKLRGVNRHDEHPDVGRATRREHWLEDIKMMKAANINYIRLSHYTPARGFVELCDELGMYLGNEVSLGGASGKMYDPSFVGAVLVRSYETVVRDINSPSIIYWSIGNEDPLTTLHMASITTVKGLDPTRPVLIPWRHEAWLPPEIDIVAPHYWKPREYDAIAGSSTRPVITTEYTHAYGTHGFGGLEARWKELTKHPAGAGGAVWVWADQALKIPLPKTKSGGTIDDDLWLTTDGWDGVVTAYRKPTRDYWEVKAVYAQAYPLDEKIFFVPGADSARVRIQNDFDFTDLESIGIEWSIREDERELAKGKAKLAGRPHAAATLELPLETLREVRADRSYYVTLSFFGKDGAEFNRKAVELVPSVAARPAPKAPAKIVVEKSVAVSVQAGDSRFLFDPKTGHLVSVSSMGKNLVTGLKPVIWRQLDTSEQSVVGRANVREAADLNKFTPSVVSWEVVEEHDRVSIKAKVDYIVDEKNSFAADYVYSVDAAGTLHVHYSILPKVAVPCVPIVGMIVDSVSDLREIRWFGLGPYDAYPNKRAAPVLGVWGSASGADEVVGTKAMRWVERRGASGAFRVVNDGYLERDKSSPDRLRILSGIVSRPEKGRKADDSFPQLETETGKPLVGGFSIVPL